MREYNSRMNQKLNSKDIRSSEKLRDIFRIFFPTDRTVGKSKGGRQVSYFDGDETKGAFCAKFVLC